MVDTWKKYSGLDLLTGAKERRAARAAADEQKKLIAQQKQRESAELAESEGQVARRKAMALRPTGRASLIATSPTGTSRTLGGT